MSVDERLLWVAAGDATRWEAFRLWPALALSARLRARRRRFLAVSRSLRRALADPDDLVVVRIEAKGRPAWTPILLAVLVLLAVFEWRSYTLPALGEWLRYVAHRCGIE